MPTLYTTLPTEVEIYSYDELEETIRRRNLKHHKVRGMKIALHLNGILSVKTPYGTYPNNLKYMGPRDVLVIDENNKGRVLAEPEVGEFYEIADVTKE